MQEFINRMNTLDKNGQYFKRDHSAIVKEIIDNHDPNHLNMICIIGLCYEYGIGVRKDLQKAFEYYIISASKGNSRGQNNMGICYKYGYGVPTDLNEAFKYFTLSAEQKDSIGLYNLGICYMQGVGTSKNITKAIECFNISISLGNSTSLVELGICYKKGIYDLKDFQKSIDYFVQLSDMDSDDLCNLAIIYEDDYFGLKDAQKALEYYKKALEIVIDDNEIKNSIKILEKELIKFTGIRGSSLMNPEDTCNICYEPFIGNNKDILVIRCGHSYHYSCLKNWSMKCPLCFIEVL
jgi:TPR repeat protein